MNDNVSREARVWCRVMGTAEAAPAAVANREDAIMDFIKDEIADSCTYRTLARCMSGCARRMLLQFAAEEACHAKKLGAVYYLLTGRKACPDCPKAPCISCVNETLRERYEEELAGSKAYADFAATAGEQACLYEELAADEARHARGIICILQGSL